MTKTLGTYILIGANVLVFAWLAFRQQSIMMNSQADVLAILWAGADFNPLTLNGEPWRLVTSMFLHFGILHLAVNMYGLYGLGMGLEPAIGTSRFLMVYFLCGLAGGVASLVFNVYVISAGASGAIFGIYGYRLGAELIGSFHDREKLRTVVINFVIFVVINAVITAQVSVDLSGHIGGCIMGLVLAVCHFKLRWLLDNRVLAAVLVIFPCVLFALPKDQVRYYEAFQKILQIEKRTNGWMRTMKNDAEVKDSLKTVLPAWDSVYRSIASLSHVPGELAADTTTLKQYVVLRKEETYYRVQLVERESYTYLDSLELNGQRFDSLPPLRLSLNYSTDEKAPVEPDTTSKSPGPRYDMVKVLFDSTWHEIEDPISAVFFRVGTRDSLGRWQGQVRDYYRDGVIQMKGSYVDGLRDGVFRYYSERGTYESSGRYNQERAVGKWERFHWNGKLREEVAYEDGGFTRNVWDSLGRPQVTNGFGKQTLWYHDGKVREEGSYENGKREGYWRGYHPNGRPYYEDLYRNNRLIRGVAVSRDGKRYVYDELSEYPMPVKGMPDFKKYLYTALEKNPRLHSGVVKVIFNVGPDGSTWDYLILESTCRECNAEALELVKNGPPWRPGVLHGHQKIQGQGYVEVVF